MLTTTTLRDTLLRRAQGYKKELTYDFVSDDYIVSKPPPCESIAYEREQELIVPAEPFEITPARLTMNPYNSLVLNSPTMFIADIDIGDPRLSPFATVKDQDEIFRCIDDLPLFDAEYAREKPIRDAS